MTTATSTQPSPPEKGLASVEIYGGFVLIGDRIESAYRFGPSEHTLHVATIHLPEGCRLGDEIPDPYLLTMCGPTLLFMPQGCKGQGGWITAKGALFAAIRGLRGMRLEWHQETFTEGERP